jgi:CO/xanthine dehydrogenase FAD-binding subunit
MKPAPFAYEAPHSLAAALELLSDEGSVALAGGQSLVPLLNLRLARPALLVDLNPIDELAYVRSSDGSLRIGALTRQATIVRSTSVQRGWPLLVRAVEMVGHAAIRSRGTVGGSVAHADPRAELPAALIALDARLHATSRSGERCISAEQFFLGPLTTDLMAGELLTEIEVPPPPAGARAAFVERARTHAAFATGGAAVVFVPGEHSAIALLGAGPTPVRAAQAEEALTAGAAAADVAELATANVLDDYRRALLTALVLRALESAQP